MVQLEKSSLMKTPLSTFVRFRSRHTLSAVSALAVVLTLTGVPNQTQAECVAPLNGLVSWWAFDGDFIDLKDNNPLETTGTPAFTEGYVDNALVLDQFDEVWAPASAALDVGAGQGMTIEGWFKPQDPNAREPLVEWNDGHGGSG